MGAAARVSVGVGVTLEDVQDATGYADPAAMAALRELAADRADIFAELSK
jgi:hypothetical protein